MLANPLQLLLARLHADLAPDTRGEVATYIPELGRANPDHFGISVATVDGHVYSVGDAAVPFTIQSISKPFVYGLALDDLGMEAVLAKVGVEPSGEAFNAISLEPGSGRPRNPMINAGAIASAGLIKGEGQEPFNRILAMLSAYAGRPLVVDESVYNSEKETGHRNRAIGHLLRNAGILEGDVDAVCNRYFRQCAVNVSARDLSLMAATMANGGRNPLTGQRAVGPEHVERLLSVMSTCGMYDWAGSWVYRVGMPAKSGVGGGILAVLPGQLGVGVFSPRLDSFGNSVRGVAACEELSREFGLHLLRPPVSIDSVVRTSHRLPQVRSRRRRSEADLARIEANSRSAWVFQLQGPLVFSTAEVAIRHTLDRVDPGGIVVFDLRRVTGLEPAVGRLLASFVRELARGGGETVFAFSGRPSWEETLRASAIDFGVESGLRFAPDLDAAIEWCETALLADETETGAYTGQRLAIEDHPLAASLPPGSLAELTGIARLQRFAPGESIICAGTRADVVYVLAAGSIEVSISVQGARHRLATQGPGTGFGELALLSAGTRSADVAALGEVACFAIAVDDLKPGSMLRLHLVEALAIDMAERLRRANAEIAALAS